MKPRRPVLFSVAHSAVSPGASTPDGVMTEYFMSLRATLAAIRNLAGAVPIEWFDVGPYEAHEYDDLKVDAINRCMPSLAIEIHCNAGPASANYSEVVHHILSPTGKAAAEIMASTLAEGFKAGHHKNWPSRGARPNTVAHDRHLFFMLERTKVPTIIIESLFISNLEQAAWLTAEGGPEAIGALVASGVKRWIKSEDEAP